MSIGVSWCQKLFGGSYCHKLVSIDTAKKKQTNFNSLLSVSRTKWDQFSVDLLTNGSTLSFLNLPAKKFSEEEIFAS